MRKAILFLAVAGAIIPARAQEVPDGITPGGSIDGEAIPAQVFTFSRLASTARLSKTPGRGPVAIPPEKEIQADMRSGVCGKLRGAIDQIARDTAKRELAIVVTKEELDAARASIPSMDPVAESNKLRAHAALMLSALSAVYDHGQDEHQTWVQMLKPQGVEEAEWYIYLHQGNTPEGRAKIEKRLAMTPDAVAKSIAAVNLEPLVAGRKLDEAVDRQIGANDPQFRTYLEDWKSNAADPDPRRRWLPAVEQKYLDSKREVWWKSRMSKISVFLNDGTLATTCGLGQMGVQGNVR